LFYIAAPYAMRHNGWAWYEPNILSAHEAQLIKIRDRYAGDAAHGVYKAVNGSSTMMSSKNIFLLMLLKAAGIGSVPGNVKYVREPSPIHGDMISFDPTKHMALSCAERR
jgi:hypothetical protein